MSRLEQLSSRNVTDGGASGTTSPGGRTGQGYQGPHLRASTALPVGTTILLLATWQLLAESGVLPDEVPSVVTVVSWLSDQAVIPEFWSTVAHTVWHWFAGLALGCLCGVAVGSSAGSSAVVGRLLSWPLEFLRPIPAIVYLPLMVLVMGARSQTAILLAAVGAVWPMLFQAMYAIRAVDPITLETGQVFGLTYRQRVAHIIVPSVLPHIATGLRISSSLSLVVAISAEVIGGIPGIGAALSSASINGRYVATYGLLAVSGLLGIILNRVLELAEHRVLKWHVSHRAVPS